MRPRATSSYRASPGRIARPAASADVHPARRNAFERRSQIAPEPAGEAASAAGEEGQSETEA